VNSVLKLPTLCRGVVVAELHIVAVVHVFTAELHDIVLVHAGALVFSALVYVHVTEALLTTESIVAVGVTPGGHNIPGSLRVLPLSLHVATDWI
jgi:hypothetical protein